MTNFNCHHDQILGFFNQKLVKRPILILIMAKFGIFLPNIGQMTNFNFHQGQILVFLPKIDQMTNFNRLMAKFWYFLPKFGQNDFFQSPSWPRFRNFLPKIGQTTNFNY